MYRIERSALVKHSAIDMFHLVNDIEAYPEFLKWCKSSQVLSDNGQELTAELEISWKVLHKKFSTRNVLKEGETIRIALLTGPFKSMEGVWHFKQLREDACKVTMDIEFEFKNSVSNFVFSGIFNQICGALMASFICRADEIYG